jgi:benzoate-CoA ligase family protein
MKRGADIDITIPEDLSLTAFYLEQNIARGRGEKIAAYYQDDEYSFNDICSLTNKVGNVLKRLGIEFEDRVLLILNDSPEWLAGWFATMKLGGVATHAYTYLLPSDYDYLLNYVQPKVVIVDKMTLPNLREAARHFSHPVLLLVAGDDLPTLEIGEFGLNALVDDASAILEVPPANKSNLAFWNFSGGTTGKWKGVPHSHDHGIIGFESFQHEIHYTSEDIVLRVPKLFFHYSRDLGMNWPFRAGAAVCLCPERTTPELIFQLIEKYRPTVLLNVPTMMRAMLQSPAAKNADLSCIRLCLSSGELLSEQLNKEFTQTFGVEVINSHGSAETYLPYFMDRPGDVRPGSSGRIMPLVEVKIVDEHGHEVAAGETGALRVRSGANGLYYHLEPEKSDSTFLGNNWVNTSDLFREDEDGYFWFMGRTNDLIKVSGVYVAPLEIEKCLAEHQAVAECVVLAVKDADDLMKTKAFIVLKEGFEPSEFMAKELNAFCKQKIASFKTPKFIEFMSELPKTGQGKIDKRQLLMRGSSINDRTGHAFAAV